MKRFAAILIAILIGFCLCSCEHPVPPPDESNAESVISPSESPNSQCSIYADKAPIRHAIGIDHNAFEATHAAIPRSETAIDAEIAAAASEKKQAIRSTETDVTVTGTAYYISSDGNDSNSGLSPESSWKTIGHLNSVDFCSGDAVFFKRGDLWRGECLELKAGVTYSAYGEGEKPAIYGSPENGAGAEKWTLLEGTDNIWVFHQDVLECGTVVLNDSQWVSKINPYLRDGQLLMPDESERPFDVKEALSSDLSFYSEDDTFLVYHDAFEGPRHPGKLYLRCDAGNPGALFSSIEFCPWTNTNGGKGLLYTRDPEEIGIIRDPIIVDNLTVKYTGGYGMYLCGASAVIKNCEVGWIGGCTLWYFDYNRFGGSGNCVGNYGDIDNYQVLNCYLYQAYDTGISCEECFDETGSQQNIVLEGNLIEDCLFGIEFFVSDTPGLSVDLVHARVSDNIILDTGYGFGSARQLRLWNIHDAAIMFHPYYAGVNDVLVSNNILSQSNGYLILCGTEEKPVFSENTYVQNDLGGLCLWGTGTGSQRGLEEYLFNNKAGEVVREIIGDKAAKLPDITD